MRAQTSRFVWLISCKHERRNLYPAALEYAQLDRERELKSAPDRAMDDSGVDVERLTQESWIRRYRRDAGVRDIPAGAGQDAERVAMRT